MTIEEIVEREIEKALPCRGPRRSKIFNSAISINRAARTAGFAIAKAVGEEFEQDAKRWRFWASSPQTALILGSQLDPNDKAVDWLAESNRLVDTILATSQRTSS